MSAHTPDAATALGEPVGLPSWMLWATVIPLGVFGLAGIALAVAGVTP